MTTALRAELDQVVKKAYDVFGVYRIESPLGACTQCCLTPDEEQQLLNTPVEEISFELMALWFSAAKSIEENRIAPKYFLPRVLELISQRYDPTIVPEQVFQDVAMEDNSVQGKLETEVISSFCNRIICDRLKVYDPGKGLTILELLEMAWFGRVDILPSLELWKLTNTKEAALWFWFMFSTYIEFRNGFSKTINCNTRISSASKFDAILDCWLNDFDTVRPQYKAYFLV